MQPGEWRDRSKNQNKSQLFAKKMAFKDKMNNEVFKLHFLKMNDIFRKA